MEKTRRAVGDMNLSPGITRCRYAGIRTTVAARISRSRDTGLQVALCMDKAFKRAQKNKPVFKECRKL